MAFDALVTGLTEPDAGSRRSRVQHPLGGFPVLEHRALFEDWRRTDSAAGLQDGAVEALERLQPYHLGGLGPTLSWVHRLATDQSHGRPLTFGLHLNEIRVGPVNRLRRARASVDVVEDGRAFIGSGERLVLARVRCPSAQVAEQVCDDVRVDLTASLVVADHCLTQPVRIPMIERMAQVEDFLYLATARMSHMSDPSP